MTEEVALPSSSPGATGVAEPPAAEPAGGEFLGAPGGGQLNGQAARPQLIRALNEQLLLNHIRQLGSCSRADLARLSGLSKPTVSLALANLERSGLIRIAGQRTGVPGRSARLFEISPDAGFVLGLDIGHHYLRGALADLTGQIRARQSARTQASSVRGRVAELIRLADALCAEAGVARGAITQ
jgi:DNA-binding transcriptional ArsR family regulator